MASAVTSSGQPNGGGGKRKDTAASAQFDQFFLYTKLNQNDTKTLRKAQTNKEERRVLANIFNIQTHINKMDVLLLDFHYINYEFCKEQQFSNEKTSTFLAMMDFIFHYMLDKQIIPETGFKVLKQVLDKHSLQRPPFSILIFDSGDIQKILQFTLKTFFRHYSLYEFSFKPRMELVLKFEPFMNTKFNAELPRLEEMTPVDEEEADKLKVYLSLFNQQLNDLNLDNDPLNQQPPLQSDRTNNNLLGNASARQLSQHNEQLDQEEEEEQVDWKKVGKQYKGHEGIESVLEREMNRLRQAMEKKIIAQDIELEEKLIAAKGKKK